MESALTPVRMHRGSMLLMVLIVTAVGLLFGAGALLLFRYQCQLRIDRQHELEKVYAVRSALNYISANSSANSMSAEGKSFLYNTDSGRVLPILIKPVAPIFPVTITNDDESVFYHFDMNSETTRFRTPCTNAPCQCRSHYNSAYDYEYGWETIPMTNLVMSNQDNDNRWGLAFRDLRSEKGSKWWVNIGMRGTGSWLQEDYGRRYAFFPQSYVEGYPNKDTLRFCLIRNVTNATHAAGYQHGWPLSVKGEQALIFEIRPKGNAGGEKADKEEDNNASFSIVECEHIGSGVKTNQIFRWDNCPSMRRMGVQLAGNMVSLFHIATDNSGGYTFLGGENTSNEPEPIAIEEFYEYFANPQKIGGILYPGTNTVDGKCMSPEMRAVFEVEATSDARSGDASSVVGQQGSDVGQQMNFLNEFKVTPAWQFDVFLEHPPFVTNRATIAQKVYVSGKGRSSVFTTLTYDTHGTENKGFRKDEREAERKRNGR